MTEPTPAWAQSVDAFAAAQRQSVAASSATSLQFPDTSQLGGVCGNLLGGSSMTSGLMAAGDSSQGTAGSLVSGTQFFSDLFCGMMGGTGTDTSPQQIAAGGQDVADAVNTTPMASGTIAAGGSTGNSALDAINGLQNLSNQMYSILAGCGCAPQLSPDQVSPQQIVDTTQATADGVNNNPMASGVIALGQDPTGSGNVALDALNGLQTFANGIYNILAACGCGSTVAPDNATPQTITDSTQNAADAVTNSPFASGILAMGQDPTGSGNVAVDAVNGTQNFANGLFSICALFGCGITSGLPAPRMPAGPLVFAVDSNPYSPVNVSPQTIIDVATAVAGAVTSNPFANDLLGGGSGNIAIDALSSGQGLADQVHTAVSGTLTSGASLQDVATAGSTAINQNTANHAGHTSLTTAQSVALKDQNLLVSQDFSSAYAVVGDTNWTWDGTDGAPTTNVLGCAKVICDGTQKPLVSSEIPVVVGENIEVSTQVKWSGLTYTGTSPIILAVEKYRLMKDPAGSGHNTYVDVGWKTVYTVPSPGAASSGWTGISGTYTVEAGVDQLRFRLEPAPNATAGTLKWDDAAFLKLDLIADDCVPGVGLTVDDIVTQLYGTSGSGFTHNASAVALGNTAASLVSVTATLANLAAEGSTGAIAGDDFNYVSEITASANWGGSYSGGSGGQYNANGIDATWAPADLVIFSDTRQSRFDWQGSDSVSTTDYQIIQLVLDSAPTDGFSADHAYIYLCGRVSADWRSYIGARFGSDGTYQVGRQVSGVWTAMASGTCAVPGLGSSLTLYCGDKATTSPRHFKLQVGTLTISEFDEVGTASLVGSSNRKWGWGASSAQSLFGQGVPPAINQWLAMDQ